jgi:hypothetical protein
MHGKWLLREYVSRMFLVGALLVLLVAETTVIVAFLGLPKVHASSVMVHLLASVFVTSIPGIAGVKGYYVAKRLRLALDVNREETTVMWLSRQYLATAIAAYGAVIMNVIFLTEAMRPR